MATGKPTLQCAYNLKWIQSLVCVHIYIYDAVFLPQYQYASVGVPSNKAKRICAAEKRLSSPAFGAS